MLSVHDHPPDRDRLAARARAILGFAGFAAGLVIAARLPEVTTIAWAGLAACFAAVALLTRDRLAIAALSVALLGAGAMHWSARVHDRAADSLAAMLPAQAGAPPMLIEIEGTAIADPERVLPRRGALSEHVPPFMAESPAERLAVRVELVQTAAGPRGVSGVALVRTNPGMTARAGDRVRALGRANPQRPAANPGQAGFVDDARARGDSFWLSADHPELVRVIDHPTAMSAVRGAAYRAFAWPRRTAHAIVDRATAQGDPDAAALIRGLLLGERDTDGPGLAGAFRRIGLAHLLSVSGFHVAVMAFVAIFVVRATGDRGWVEPAIVAGAIALYMLVVPARAPIMRAGFMVLVLLICDALGRRHDRLAVLAWVGVAVLLWRPTELFSIGFQLSFGLVAWLLLIAEPRPDRISLSHFEDPASRPLWRGALRWMADMARATAACWSVSIPLIIYHTGAVAPLAIAATLITVPLIIVTMWIGFATLLIGAFAPALVGPLAMVLRAPAAVCAQIVRWFDATPIATLYLPGVSIAWTIFATLTIAWLWRRGRLRSPVTWLLPALAGLWLGLEAWQDQRLPGGVSARATMLDVRNGTAIVVESGSDALLWDCGSFRESIGVRTIPEACRAIGAARVRTVVLTHANIDHFMGLPDIARRLGVRTVVTGESFARAAEASDAARAVLDFMAEAGIEHRVVSAGDTITLGSSRLEILHPPAGFVARQENDASLVARLSAGADAPAMLLTGDIQDEAMAMLMTSGTDLAADVIELPHHGSARGAAYEFVARVNPSVVLQSTGAERLDDPRWDRVRPGRLWLATPRHGAVRADLRADGTIDAGPVR